VANEGVAITAAIKPAAHTIAFIPTSKCCSDYRND